MIATYRTQTDKDSVLRGLPDDNLTKIIVMDSMDCESLLQHAGSPMRGPEIGPEWLLRNSMLTIRV
jgi:hypothetical protein